jgi:hypothetical protein
VKVGPSFGMPNQLPQLEVEDLLAEIEATFGPVRLGDGTSLHQADALDDYSPPDVVAAARSFDTEERWQDIPDDKVDHFDHALAFMDAEGFRFHVPRFMVSAVTRAGVHCGVLGGDAAVYAFHFTDELEEYAMSKYALLSPEQRRTIARFLRFAASHDEWFDAPIATEALERYWGQYA